MRRKELLKLIDITDPQMKALARSDALPFPMDDVGDDEFPAKTWRNYANHEALMLRLAVDLAKRDIDPRIASTHVVDALKWIVKLHGGRLLPLQGLPALPIFFGSVRFGKTNELPCFGELNNLRVVGLDDTKSYPLAGGTFFEEQISAVTVVSVTASLAEMLKNAAAHNVAFDPGFLIPSSQQG